MKVYFRYNRLLYDGNSGEVVEAYKAGKGVIVEVTNRVSHKEKKEKFDAKYLYKKKDGGYIGSAFLTTTFLYEVARDRLGSERIVLSTRACMVAFIGGRQEFYHFSSREEKEKLLEEFFQGMDYREEDIASILSLVLPSPYRKPLAVLLPVLALLIFWLAGKVGGGEEEVIAPPPVIRQEAPVKSLEEVAEEKIMKTQVFLSEFFKSVKPYTRYDPFFVSDVDFSSGVFKVGAFFPANGFRYNGRFYEKVFAVETRKALKGLPKKSVEECRKVLLDAGARPEEVSDLQEKYLVSGSIAPDKLFLLVKGLYGCPVFVEGSISYENLMNRRISLEVMLYKIGGEKDEGEAEAKV